MTLDDIPFRRFSPETQCEGKQRYSTKAAAKTAARRAERSIGRTKPYRCPHCSTPEKAYFHIGHQPAWKQAQRPA